MKKIGKMSTSKIAAFSWAQLHERLAALATANRFDEISEQNFDELLTARAAQLARVVSSRSDADDSEELIFKLGDERYAIEMHYVIEVIPYAQITFVPGVPAFVLGITSRRGEIISIIDLINFFDLSTAVTPRHIVLVESAGLMLGIAVDEIVEISRLPARANFSLPTQLSGEHAQFLAGVTDHGIGLLKIAELLSCEKIIIDQN